LFIALFIAFTSLPSSLRNTSSTNKANLSYDSKLQAGPGIEYFEVLGRMLVDQFTAHEWSSQQPSPRKGKVVI
jgi:hypothetical protein